MKKLILVLLIGWSASVSGQTKMIIHDMFAPKGVPYPFFDGHYVWWNDSTITYVSYYDSDSTRTLYQRINFLMRDDLDTHRRLDSLIDEIRGWMKPGKPTYSGHNN